MHVRAYIRRNDWPVVIPPVVHPEVHAAITLLVPRRGIHVRRGRCVKRHNGQISENPNAPMQNRQRRVPQSRRSSGSKSLHVRILSIR